MTNEVAAHPPSRWLSVAPAGLLAAASALAPTVVFALAGTDAATVTAAAADASPAIAAQATLLHPLADGLALRIEVPADEPAAGGSVDLVIFEEAPGGLIMGRLSTRRVGQLRNSWRTDLDDDRAPEYVLAFAAPASAAGDAAPETLQVWEWRAEAHAFVRMELPPLETDAPILERRLVVAEEYLQWQVVLQEPDGDRERATYRLDLDDGRWERRRGWLPW